jgi:hypothetical protein
VAPFTQSLGSGTRALAALLVAGTLYGCAGRGAEPNVAMQAAPDSTFGLRVGERAVVGGTLLVLLVGVTDDSRCPVDVRCVWAGDARVRLRVSESGGTEREVELHTSVEPRWTLVAGHRLSLEALRPEPRSGRTIAPDAYVAELRASRD